MPIGFISAVSEPELGLGRLERAFDRSTLPLECHRDHDPRAGRAPGREEGPFAVAQAAADQEPTRPQAGLIVGGTSEVGQFAIGSVV